MSLQEEKIRAQTGAFNVSGAHWWGCNLVGPSELEHLLKDATTLDRIRAHFQHGADEEAWPPGTPLDVAVGKLVEKVYGSQATPMTSDRA